MTEIEFVEVDSEGKPVKETLEKFVDRPEKSEVAKKVAVEQDSDEQVLDETKKYFKRVFASMGGTRERF
ncbi:hypothetical protein [Rhodococcus sp. JT-3]|uniref:hypothetical protein n=1 Tax=Rhodococcus sp. JT-3 TaxID=1973213 RepID=UPI001303AF4A|nr:hypothetical protein [Rhodococcus sp. JT-3]